MRDIVLAKTLADADAFLAADLGKRLNDPYIMTPSAHLRLRDMPLGRLFMTSSAPEHPGFTKWMRTVLYRQGKMLAKLEV